MGNAVPGLLPSTSGVPCVCAVAPIGVGTPQQDQKPPGAVVAFRPAGDRLSDAENVSEAARLAAKRGLKMGIWLNRVEPGEVARFR